MRDLYRFYRYEVIDKENKEDKESKDRVKGGWYSLDKLKLKEIGLCQDIINMIDLYVTPPDNFISREYQDIELIGLEREENEVLLERNFRGETVEMVVELMDLYRCSYNDDDIINLLMIFEECFGKLEEMVCVLYNYHTPQWKEEKKVIDKGVKPSIVSYLRGVWDHPSKIEFESVKSRIWNKYFYNKLNKFIDYFNNNKTFSSNPPDLQRLSEDFTHSLEYLALHMGFDRDYIRIKV